MTTMFLMAWPIEFGHLKNAALRPAASIWGSLINVGIVPLLAWPLLAWLDHDLAGGLMIAAATPCTLASAAVWTRRAGGNDSTAMMVTLITNVSCFLVMPALIFWQSGESVPASVLMGTMQNLFWFVVVPMALAQLTRLHPGIGHWASDHKPQLSTLALLGILMMVLIGAINMGMRLNQADQQISWFNLITICLAVFGLHVIAFGLGWQSSKWMGINRGDSIAVAFAGSQKTLMVGLSVAIMLGFSIIPIVFYHAFQLIIDTLFADQMRLKQPPGNSVVTAK